MSIRFSEIILSDEDGDISRFLLGGYPDEDDLRKNEYLYGMAEDFEFPIHVSVQRYWFVAGSDVENADDHHLALINAYDELADLSNSMTPIHDVGKFTDREDVERDDYLEFDIEARKDGGNEEDE